MLRLVFISLFILNRAFGVLSYTQTITPNLPNTQSINSCFPDTSGYKRITVGPAGRDFSDLQEAINFAQPGSILLLDAGSTFYGGFILPNKLNDTSWIILMSSRIDLLPKEASRINPLSPTGNAFYPTQSSAMPKIVTRHPAGIPCLQTQAKAHHYRFVGIEITVDTTVKNSYGLIHLGDASPSQNDINLVPHHFIIDRCYIHGHSKAVIMKFGVRLDCANTAIIDCYISDFHSIGYDAQAIAGINGPGPFKIINNYLEAAGENILFGGAPPAIKDLIPSDIEIRQNYFYKPLQWKVGHPSYSGNHWTIKNLFELKTGVRVLLDGNILENSWADLPIGQSGAAILLTIRTEGGLSPQADVSDITITNNIIRHAGSGISLSGTDDGKGKISKRIIIANNLFEDIDGAAYGDLNFAGPNDGTFIKIGKPQNVTIDHNTIFQTGPVTWVYDIVTNFVFTNNICKSFISTGGYQGIYGPGYVQGNSTMSHYFPDISDSNQHFHKNVFIGGDASKYTNYYTISQNYFPKSVSSIDFVDFPNGHLNFHNYRLSVSSAYHLNGSDNKDIGVNFNALDSALESKRACNIVTTIIDNAESNKFRSIKAYPNPAHNILSVRLNSIDFTNYQIINILGEIVSTGLIYKSDFVIPIESLPNGLFLLKLLKAGSHKTISFIVAN